MMSPFATKQTSTADHWMSAAGGKADFISSPAGVKTNRLQ